MAARKPRVEVPRNPDALIKLLKKLCAKHAADGANSPLKDLENIGDLPGLCDAADKEHVAGEDFRQQAEQCTERRDKALGLHTSAVEEGTALWHLMAVRDVLLGRFKGREHRLGDWGFVVDASPKAVKPKGGTT